MPALNPQIDKYIAKSPEFAKPILEQIRTWVHQASPQITESIKWSAPSFDYNGKMLCNMAAFKQHCSVGFWLGGKIKALQPYLTDAESRASDLGRLSNIKLVKDLPKRMDFIAAVKEAILLSDTGVTLKRAPAKKSAVPPVPAAFAKALAGNKTTKAIFEKFSPSNRKEYILWITEAKTDATRDKRIATALEWIAEGKGRNWKYERK